MTATCPNGHQSATEDYCDQCGAPIAAATGAPPAAPGLGVTSTDDEVETSPAAPAELCPQCGAARTGGDRYCEGCGYDFDAPAATWEAIATADRSLFERLAPAGVEFPDGYAERRFPVTETEVRIGRSHGRPANQAPEINLAVAPEDPAISHLHAVLERQQDGSYALRDLGSTNGTTLNDDPTPIGAHAAPLADGDRIHIGAWTTITLHKH